LKDRKFCGILNHTLSPIHGELIREVPDLLTGSHLRY